VAGVLDLIKSCSDQPILAGIRGSLFEQLSHENFFKPREYEVRNLKTGAMSKLTIGPLRNEKFTD
jgi:hypothetical protein